jgi:hypothetical protein
LATRLHAEYHAAEPSKVNTEELVTLLHFLEDNMNELSPHATDYITQFDNPLAELYKMVPANLYMDSADAFDGDRVQQVIWIIEDRIETLIQRSDQVELTDESTPAASTKRMIEGYEERQSLTIAGQCVVLAENPTAIDPYLVCNIKWDNPLGMEERYDGEVTDDYVEAMREFLKRADGFALTLENARRESGLPVQKLNASYCISAGDDVDLNGKALVVKPESLAPEHRSAEYQYVVCTGGFGAQPNSRGNAVYAKELYSGKQGRYERYQIAGLADPSKMPKWAVDKLIAYQRENEPVVSTPGKDLTEDKRHEKPSKNATAKPSLLGNLDKNKQKVERDKAEKKDQPPAKKRGASEVTD